MDPPAPGTRGGLRSEAGGGGVGGPGRSGGGDEPAAKPSGLWARIGGWLGAP